MEVFLPGRPVGEFPVVELDEAEEDEGKGNGDDGIDIFHGELKRKAALRGRTAKVDAQLHNGKVEDQPDHVPRQRGVFLRRLGEEVKLGGYIEVAPISGRKGSSHIEKPDEGVFGDLLDPVGSHRKSGKMDGIANDDRKRERGDEDDSENDNRDLFGPPVEEEE